MITYSARLETKLLNETDRLILNQFYCQEADEIHPDDAFREKNNVFAIGKESKYLSRLHRKCPGTKKAFLFQ